MRVNLQLFVKRCNGLIVLIEPEVGKPQIKIDLRVLGVGLQDLLEGIDGLGELQLGLINDAETLEDLKVVGIALGGFQIDLLGPRVILDFLDSRAWLK